MPTKTKKTSKSTKKETKKVVKKSESTKTTKTVKKPEKEVKKVVKEEVKKVEEPKKVEVKEVKKEEPKVEKIVKKEEKKSSKKLIIAIISIVLVVIIIAVLVIFSIKVFFNTERKLTKKITNMSKEYYANYYDQLAENRSKEDIKKVLSKFTSIGIKINLENLSNFSEGKYKKEVKEFKNGDKKCDTNNTKAIVYPQEPYGKNDYKIEIELDCGF